MPPRRRKQQVEILKEEPVETQQEESQSVTNETEIVNQIVEDLQSDQGSEKGSEQGSDQESEQGSETESSSGNGQEHGIPFGMFPEMIRQQMESMQESSSNEDLANILSVFFHNSEGENVVDSLSSIKKSIDQNSKCVLKLTKVLEDNFSKATTIANMFTK